MPIERQNEMAQNSHHNLVTVVLYYMYGMYCWSYISSFEWSLFNIKVAVFQYSS